LGFLGFLGFLKKPKKPRFFKTQFYSPGFNLPVHNIVSATSLNIRRHGDVPDPRT